jgi:predicted nuclease of predicted toxin-antitoxin system
MPKFLIDENMPRSTAQAIRLLGHEALDVRDCGLRGRSDSEVYAFAQRQRAILLTADLGFGNILHCPLGSHCGVVIAHYPNELSSSEVNRLIAQSLPHDDDSFFVGNLVILEPGTIRIRRHDGPGPGALLK